MAQVALLIDFESLSMEGEETLPGRTNPVPYEELRLAPLSLSPSDVRTGTQRPSEKWRLPFRGHLPTS
jgi:hypothetical protein